jgi:hypothetical protein
MKTTNHRVRTLTVKKETLRTLVDAELEQVSGGRKDNNCSGRYSGCIVSKVDTE